MTDHQENCKIRGYLYGAICEEYRVWDRIVEAQIVAVPSIRNQPNADSFARPGEVPLKPVIHEIKESEFKKLASSKGAMRGKTDANGSFCLHDESYEGALIDLYVCIRQVPAPTLENESFTLKTPCYLYLGAFKPFGFQGTWYLISVIASAIWCKIREKADLWVIVGKVAPCDAEEIGLGDVKVTAFDADIVQHDQLGVANTNPNGVFRIDYPGSNFRKGTWLNVELIGGPDVYFKIEDSDGNVLLDESPVKGFSRARCNRGPCFCVLLCVEVPPPPPPQPSAWTKVGKHFTLPDASSLNDFDADGYALPGKYAIHNNPRMLGTTERFSNGHPVEYRFRVSDTTAPNGAAPLAEANFTRVVGAGANLNLFAPTELGQMRRFSPYRVVDVSAEAVDLDGDGWLDINKSISRTFAADPILTPADIPDFHWIPSGALMAIKTGPLTNQPNVPDVGNAGVQVPAANQIAIESVAIRFEVREVVNKAANIFIALPGTGTTLNRMVVSGNNLYAKVAMAEHLTSTPCTPLSGSPHAAFTVHHPHISNVKIRVRSNDGAYDHFLADPAPAGSDAALPLAGNTNSPAVNHMFDPSVPLPAGLHKCTYTVTLSVNRRLHDGDGGIGTDTRQTTFYYEP